jgi:hypothetical protein
VANPAVPNWDPMTFDFAKDMSKVDSDEKNRSALDTMNPDLTRFRDRGGKLILYHGWGDDAISPLNTIGNQELRIPDSRSRIPTIVGGARLQPD